MEMRRQFRVVHRAKMRVKKLGSDEGVIVRVQNLSPLGVFATAPADDLPEPGSEIQCGFLFGGEPRTIRGRVAWQRLASPGARPDSAGVGIEFIEVGDDEAAILRDIVAKRSPKTQQVEIWFEGSSAPTPCQATVSGSELQMATRLAFMRLQSTVRLGFTDQALAEVRVGTIESVSMAPTGEDGTPELHIGVALPAVRAVAGERNAPAEFPADDSAQPDPETALSPLPIRSRLKGWLRWLSQGWRPAIAGAVVGAALIALLQPLIVTAPPSADRTTHAVGPIEPIVPVRTPVDPATASNRPSLTMQTEGRTSHLRLELQGTGAGGHQRALAHPSGIGLTLPRGHLRLEPGIYSADGAPLLVEVQRRGAGSELLFLFDTNTHGAKLRAETDSVTLDLTARE
jgi:hypothetical protein